MDSTEPTSTETDPRTAADSDRADAVAGSSEVGRLRAALRWLPVAVLAVLVAASYAVVVRLDPAADAPPPAAATDGTVTLDVPLLSLRRDLEPLRRASADRRFHDSLVEFVAAQPPDTCLHVSAGPFRFDHRVDDPQSPASLQKLLTAVAALEVLDPAATFTTEVLVTAPPVDGVVGELYLRGGGDPILATAEYMARERNQPQTFTDLDALADEVVAAGVRVVAGAVIGDEGRYDVVRTNPAWPRRFLAQGQAGPLSALSVNDGFAYFPDGGDLFGAADDPAAYAAEVFARALRARGVAVDGAGSGVTATGAVPLAALASPPVDEVVAQMLRESDNNTAELLVKEIGLVMRGDGSTEAGTAAITDVLAAVGVDVGAAVVLDGSGLAPGDQVTCALVAEVLALPATADAIEAGLPVAGRTGTLTRRFARPEVAGRVRAKTGTLNQVTALAGIVDTDGAEARFSLVVNVPASDRIPVEVVAAQERLVDLLVGHPRLPDLSSFRPG